MFAASSRFMLSSKVPYSLSDSWSCFVRRKCLLCRLTIIPLRNLILQEYREGL